MRLIVGVLVVIDIVMILMEFFKKIVINRGFEVYLKDCCYLKEIMMEKNRLSMIMYSVLKVG